MSASQPPSAAVAAPAASTPATSWWSWLAPLLVVPLVLLFFAKMAFSNLILARGDTFLYFYPYWQMAADALRAGRVPLWNPNIFMGAPFIANSQVGFFYPLNWPVWWLFETPYAVSASILIHLALAGLGTYRLARRVFDLPPAGALLAAVLYALGGYLTAQVEHINQLQGLAWLPWLFVVVQPVVGRPGVPVRVATWMKSCILLAAIIALQVLAGHTQSAFISGVALTLWLLVYLVSGRASRTYVVQVGGLLLVSVGIAGLLAAVQLLPTLELTANSARQGGLSLAEVLSFSWHPLLITRSLLPSYGQSLFTEYVAFLPLTALLLAVVGGWRWRGRPPVVALLVLIAVGLILALGRFTPVYWLLANLPGFDLFRVPARWLVLYALGMALLAGLGWMEISGNGGAGLARLRRPLLIGLAILLGLMVWGFAAGVLAQIVPTGPEAPFESPNLLTVVGWAIELSCVALLLFLIARRAGRYSSFLLAALIALSGAVLWFASRGLPYNNLTTPEAYFDIRPPAARLQALAACEVPGEPCRVPPDRFMSLSDLFFDPGDQAEIDAIYADQLDPAARYDYTIAIKQKEIVAPNLPMVYDLFAVDGFDGGILPLANYVELMQLILPQGEATADGRLREFLSGIPETRWLDLFNTRYLITDKTGDEWRQGVYFDRQHPVALPAGQTATVGYLPSFAADAIWLLVEGSPPAVHVTVEDGSAQILAPQLREAPGLYETRLPSITELQSLELQCPEAACTIEALTLVDISSSAFQPIVLGSFRQIYSGDVKIYEYLDAQPRAWLVYDWQWQPDVAASVAAMAAPEFDPRDSAVLTGAGSAAPPPGDAAAASIGSVTVRSASAEALDLQVETDRPGLVVLADANYPGWQATLDREPIPIVQANGLFRGVFVPAGEHALTFSYESRPYRLGLVVTVLAAASGLIVLLFAWWSGRRGPAHTT